MEFKVNKFISLKLEDGDTNIYINGVLFNHCKYVLVKKNISNLEDVLLAESIDDLAENYAHDPEMIDIPAETQFWAHCSNLQVWVEHNYDTRLLRSNLAFPLLKKLVEIGDPLAKDVFKEEVMKRYKSENYWTKKFLLEEGYLSDFTPEEIMYSILDTNEAIALESISEKTGVSYEIITEFDSLRNKNLNGKYFFSVKDGHVIELELFLTETYFEIPSEITKLRNLKILFIHLTNLDNKIPKFSIKLESIVHLKIYCGNNVIIPDAFDCFPNLYQLHIIGGGFTLFEKPPETLGQLRKLKVLYLNWVKIDILPNSLEDLKNLDSLTVKNAGLKRFPNSVFKLNKLIVLDLTGNLELRLPREKLLSKEYLVLNIDDETIYDIFEDLEDSNS